MARVHARISTDQSLHYPPALKAAASQLSDLVKTRVGEEGWAEAGMRAMAERGRKRLERREGEKVMRVRDPRRAARARMDRLGKKKASKRISKSKKRATTQY
jgi:hypothetical protein